MSSCDPKKREEMAVQGHVQEKKQRKFEVQKKKNWDPRSWQQQAFWELLYACHSDFEGYNLVIEGLMWHIPGAVRWPVLARRRQQCGQALLNPSRCTVQQLVQQQD
jgi:hypothetical protein